ncbi:MAG: hypothetical protein M3R02_12630 [Chloroflexota bacterium]|nr:hypothetical protein [Chloroflexota bacterium]
MATEIRDGTHLSDAALQRGLTPDVIPADRDAAYELWAYVHGQNATVTATALGLPANTVRSWANRDGWRQRYELERGERFETVRRATELALLRAIPDTIRMFHQVVNGQGDSRQTLDKEGNLVTVYDPVPYQARVNAGKELVALFNGPTTHHHHHTSDTPATPAPTDHGAASTPATPLTREQALAMTPAERQAWTQARLQRKTS